MSNIPNDCLIGTLILLIIVFIFMVCKHTEPFSKLREFFQTVSSKEVGYPRPQGNLSNFQYGTKPKYQDREREQWNSVLKKKDYFTPPMPMTMLN